MAWLLVLLAGCGEGAPPLDQLPLRDALRADPDVVSTLPDDARARLAARLEAARTSDVTDDVLDEGATGANAPGEATPGALVGRLDALRERRAADPLILGRIDAGVAHPVSDGGGGDNVGAGVGAREPEPALPAFEGGADATAAPTAALEASALGGAAGRSLRRLLQVSEARHLRRVVGWPIAAVAVGDAVYVNAAWLVALAPGVRGDAGADSGASPSPSAAAATAIATATTIATAPIAATVAPADTTASATPTPAETAASGVRAESLSANATAPPPSYWYPDGGTQPPAPAPPGAGDSCSSSADSCSSCADACAASSSGSDDSCDGTTTDDGSDDSCSGTSDDGSADACASAGDDGSDTSCQVSRGRPRRGGPGTFGCLLGPLAFLLPRRRR